MHYKVIPPSSYDFDGPVVQEVKIGSRGLIGEDRRLFIKRAGEELAHKAAQLMFPKGMLPVHLIALGSTEMYGPNRNGDGFKRAMLAACGHTFEKYARFYRNHKSRDPRKHYGKVVLAHFNPVMDREELLVGLYKDEKTAEENGGLVADTEQQKLARGEDLAVSMGCAVPYDVCSYCGNQAKTRANYCSSIKEGGSCPGFGCKTGLTKVGKNGKIQYVDNPEGRFGDISHVGNPADRTAYGGIADYMCKAAANGMVFGGAELAEVLGLEPSFDLALALSADPTTASLVKIAYEAASAEDDLEGKPVDSGSLAFSLPQAPFDVSWLDRPGTPKCAMALRALANERICLSPSDFVAWMAPGHQKLAELQTAVAALVPGGFSWLLTKDAAQVLRGNPYLPAATTTELYANKAAAKSAEYGLHSRSLFRRAARAGIRSQVVPALAKRASFESSTADAQALAVEYLRYKTAFLSAQVSEMPLTLYFAVRQNYAGR